MAWVVDTSIILDVMIQDSPWRPAALRCLHSYLPDGLCLCPVTFAELGPAFHGDARAAVAFFSALPVDTAEPWIQTDTEIAHRLWHEHQLRRKALISPKRPIADVLIAAFASRFQGIITRNASDFRTIAPALAIIEP